MARTFSSLKTRNFRLFFIGQLLSSSGRWMHQVAELWLILELTDSALALGVGAALRSMPLLLAGAWGGLVADRVDKRRLLFATQALMAFLAALLGVLSMLGLVRLWTVFLLTFLYGCLNIFDNPARRSFILEMVGREQLTNGVSLNSAIMTMSRVVGPAIGGLVIATAGVAACFLANALSYIGMFAALALMDPAKLHRAPAATRRKGQLREGLQYAWRAPELRIPLLMVATVSTLSWNFPVLLPLLARETFSSGAEAYGLLYALFGLGSLFGALVTASILSISTRYLVGSAAVLGTATVTVSAAPTLIWAMAVLVAVGAAGIAFFAGANSALQLATRSDMQGRVMALYSVVFAGSTAVGAPLLGSVAALWGPRAGLGFGGVIAAATALAAHFATRDHTAPRRTIRLSRLRMPWRDAG